jgi:REP element-mobilizing transposase RayT
MPDETSTPAGNTPSPTVSQPHFYLPYGAVAISKNRLPHWQQTGAIYFVTFHLADSIPAELLESWKSEKSAWELANPPPHSPKQIQEYHRKFSAQKEEWLDAGHGSCVLRHTDAGKVVAEALHFYEEKLTAMFSFVVMPNHIHALFGLLGEAELDDVQRRWKSFTSYELRKRFAGIWPGWQKSYYDRLVRDGEHFERCVRYIRHNPAKLPLGDFVLWESERAARVEERHR